MLGGGPRYGCVRAPLKRFFFEDGWIAERLSLYVGVILPRGGKKIETPSNSSQESEEDMCPVGLLAPENCLLKNQRDYPDEHRVSKCPYCRLREET